MRGQQPPPLPGGDGFTVETQRLAGRLPDELGQRQQRADAEQRDSVGRGRN